MRGRPIRRARCVAAAGLIAALAVVAAPLDASAITASTPHSTLLPAAMLPAGAHVLGSLPSHAQVRASVYLRPRDPAALAAFAAAVSDVRSPLFGHVLARGAFAARFGPTAATVAHVREVLGARGLVVGVPSSNHLQLTVTGDAAQVESAFTTTLRGVQLPGGARGRIAGTVLLPASISGDVEAVLGLDQLQPERSDLLRPRRVPDVEHALAHRASASALVRHATSPGAPSACAHATDETEFGYGGITQDEVAHAYGVDGLYAQGDLGQGQTVAVFELEPFERSDLRTFEECYFGADHTSRITVVDVDGGTGTGYGSGEAALDIENVAAIAPDANIRVYEAPNNAAGAVDDYNRIVSDDLAQVATTSWGLCESDELHDSPGSLAVENLLFEQAASQGQTFFSAAGDAGNDACAYHGAFPTNPVETVGDPASQPYVVGVGGTSAVTVTQPPTETVWNDGGNNGGGGGGISRVWVQPPWLPRSADVQSSATRCGAPRGTECRTVPDVSAFADEYTGITTYFAGTWLTVGGTSSSAPLWAAMLAEVNASATCRASVATSRGVGFVAPLLYDVASRPADYAAGFTDVTVGNNDLYGVTGGVYRAGKGYDMASGLGSPELTAAPGVTGPGLAQSLCAAAQGGGGVTILGVSPSSGSTLGGTRFTITGRDFETDGVSDVHGVSFGTSPAARYTVVSPTRIVGTTSAASTPTTNALLDRVTRGSGEVLVTVATSSSDVVIGPSFHFDVETAGRDVPTVAQLGPTGGTGRGGSKVRVYGTGFTGATAVTFGGVEARSFHVVSDVEIVAVTPGWRRSMCVQATLRGLSGLCQTEVRVTGRGGASPTVPDLPPLAGTLSFDRVGMLNAPPRCRCEAYPSATEFDYATRLTLTSIADLAGNSLAGNPGGGDQLRLTGTGLNVLTLGWVNFGPPTVSASQDYDLVAVARSGTSIFLYSAVDPLPSPTGNVVKVSVSTLAGNSDTRPFHYVPIQIVSWLSTDVLPSTGGAPFTIRGGGFRGAVQVEFEPDPTPIPPVEMLSGFKVRSATVITLSSPAMAPGSYEVFVCGPLFCGTGAQFEHPVSCTVEVVVPNSTAVTSDEAMNTDSTIPSGLTAGGTVFEIQGTNFGPLAELEVLSVNAAGDVTEQGTGIVPGPAPTDPGATETVLVSSPPSPNGAPGIVNVALSGADGISPLTPTAYFAYHT